MANKGRGAVREKPEDLYGLLKADHRRVRMLFSRILKSHKRSDDVFAQIREELDRHMRAEERHFYPALEQEQKAREFILEAYEEHEVGKELLERLTEQEDDEHWLARLKVLSDLIDHHLEEEERDVFRQARRILDKRTAREIAGRIQEEKLEGKEEHP